MGPEFDPQRGHKKEESLGDAWAFFWSRGHLVTWSFGRCHPSWRRGGSLEIKIKSAFRNSQRIISQLCNAKIEHAGNNMLFAIQFGQGNILI